MKTLGEHIRALRLSRKMKQEELAEAAGITKASISGYELDKRIPPYRVLHDIAKALDVPESTLLSYMTLDENDISPKYFIESEGSPYTLKGICYTNMISDPIDDELPLQYMALTEALNKLSNEGRKIAVQRVNELCYIPMYQRTLPNSLCGYIYDRYKLRYTLLEISEPEKLYIDDPFPEIDGTSWNVRRIILQRTTGGSTTKIWDFSYYTFDGDTDEPDVGQILCSKMSQYQPGCSLGFIFDNYFAFDRFYSLYKAGRDAGRFHEDSEKNSSMIIFMNIEKDSLDIKDVREYAANI